MRPRWPRSARRGDHGDRSRPGSSGTTTWPVAAGRANRVRSVLGSVLGVRREVGHILGESGMPQQLADGRCLANVRPVMVGDVLQLAPGAWCVRAGIVLQRTLKIGGAERFD